MWVHVRDATRQTRQTAHSVLWLLIDGWVVRWRILKVQTLLKSSQIPWYLQAKHAKLDAGANKLQSQHAGLQETRMTRAAFCLYLIDLPCYFSFRHCETNSISDLWWALGFSSWAGMLPDGKSPIRLCIAGNCSTHLGDNPDLITFTLWAHCHILSRRNSWST